MSESDSKRSAPTIDRTPPTPSDLPSTVAPSIEGQQDHSGRLSATTPSYSKSFRVPEQPRSASAAGESHQAKAPKVAIPRLRKDVDGSPIDAAHAGGRHRVTHACEPCRQRKTKCSGERPICKHCQDFKIACYYADGKRDRVKKQFGTMAEKLADYESLLKDLTTRVNAEDGELIRKSLEKEALKDIESPGSRVEIQGTITGDEEDELSGGESDVSGDAGSTGALDRIEEDFARNEESRATGFFGKNSEITWMQRLRQENKLGSPQDSESRQHFQERAGEYTVSESSYHLDDFPVSIPDAIDPYEIPPKEMAENLFNAYLNSVHASLPLIGKATFTSQFRRFFSAPRLNPGPKWLAIMNMIFAISARYSHLIQAPWAGDDRDHLVYFTRARMLSINGDTLFSHPDLQQVQIEGLCAFYLIATNQVNRAWLISGMAVRAAIGLGLNMRNESSRTPDTSKEIRYRVWWSLYILEQQISIMTGRPTSILDHVCTTPLPVPFEEDAFQTHQATHCLSAEMQKTRRFPLSRSGSNSNRTSTPASEQSSSGSKPTPPSRSPSNPQATEITSWAGDATPNLSLYFLHYVELTRIKQDVLNELYTPEAMTNSWSQIQNIIQDLSDRANTWLANLPGVFDFTRKQRDQNFLEQRITLGFSFYGARIVTTRPCLCRIDRKIPRQSSRSKGLNRQFATACIDAARAMLDLIPDQPNAIGLNKLSPWWCILHFLVQATTVLMLEVSFRADHMPEQAENILESAKKGVRWLFHMSEQSLAAARAWKLCDTLIRDAAPKIGGSVEDLPTQQPQSMQVMGSMDSGLRMQPAVDLSFAPTTISRLPAMQGQLNVPFYTGYDQYMPATTAGQSDDFPTSAEIDFLSDEFHNQGETQQTFHMGNGPVMNQGGMS